MSSNATGAICALSGRSSNTPSFYCSGFSSSTPSSGSSPWRPLSTELSTELSVRDRMLASRRSACASGDSPSSAASISSVAADALSSCFLGDFGRDSRARRACTRTRIAVNSHPARTSALRSSGACWRSSAAAAPLAAPSSSSADLASMTATCFANAGGRACWTRSCSAASRRWRCKRSSSVDSPFRI